jgi:hypothetical protein
MGNGEWQEQGFGICKSREWGDDWDLEVLVCEAHPGSDDSRVT